MPAGTELAVRIGPAVAPVIVAEDQGNGYVLTASVFQTELEIIDISTQTVWFTAVADIKSNLWIEQEDVGVLSVGFTSPAVELGLVGDGAVHSAWDLAAGLRMETVLEALIASQLEQVLISMPAPRVAVFHDSITNTELLFDMETTKTLSSGEHIRTLMTVD